MTTLSNAITRVEDLIKGTADYNGVWARTDRGPGKDGTTLDGWTTTQGDVAGLSLGTNEIVGRHAVSSGAARRITAHDLTSTAGVTSITTLAWATAPTTGTAFDIRDGFTKCPPSQRIEKNLQDRWFQVRPAEDENLEGYGNGQDRIRLNFNVLCCYMAGFKGDESPLRAAEDYAAIRAVITNRANMVSGVNLFSGEASSIHFQDDAGRAAVWAFPFDLIYYRTRAES